MDIDELGPGLEQACDSSEGQHFSNATTAVFRMDLKNVNRRANAEGHSVLNDKSNHNGFINGAVNLALLLGIDDDLAIAIESFARLSTLSLKPVKNLDKMLIRR